MTWYVVLCRQCNDQVHSFRKQIERARWWRTHGEDTDHYDFWLAQSDETEH